jgi:tetratricopeptide (TPR) repeat protein
MLPNIRNFYTAALRFHELIVTAPLSFSGEDDTHSLQEKSGEDRYLTFERSLILIHLGCNEESAPDFVRAIGFYKEALAILTTSAFCRYNIPFLSGSHWGDDNDDDGSTSSNIDCRSDLSGSIASSQSAPFNVTYSSFVSLALHRMGICYLNTGEYEAAAECLRKAVELRKKELVDPTKIVDTTSHHFSITRREREVDLAESLQWLATAYREKNSPDKAYEILRDCMIVKLLLFGKNNVEVANVQFNMGIILGDLSRHEESLECYREALSVQRHHAKEKDVANTLFCMGNVFLRVHTDYQNALECFLEAVLMLENVVGLASVAFNIDEAKCLGGIEPYHIFYDSELEKLKLIERQEKYYNYDRMIHYYTISLDIVSNQIDDFIGLGSFFKSANSRRSDFKDQVITCKVFILEGLSKVYMAQMKWKSALEVLQRKLKILRSSWEQNNSNYASNENQLIDKEYEKTLYHVAHVLFKLRRFQEAKQCYTDVLEARRADSRSTELAMACGVADALHNKGRCFEELSLLNDAIQCYEESLGWRDKADYDENHLESLLFKANTIFHLGSTHLLQNKCEKAKELFDQCMVVFETDGNHTLSEAFVLQCIGKLYHLKKELPSALECYSRSLQIYRDAIGHDENVDQALAKELAVYIAEAFHNIGGKQLVIETSSTYLVTKSTHASPFPLFDVHSNS